MSYMKSAGLTVALVSLLITNVCCQRLSYNELTAISKKVTVTVVVFISPDCPISQKYLGELNNIADQHAPSKLLILGFIPGKIGKGELQKFKEEYNIHFDIYNDRDYEWVKKLNGNITPEAYVFDNLGLLKY